MLKKDYCNGDTVQYLKSDGNESQVFIHSFFLFLKIHFGKCHTENLVMVMW